MVNSSSGRQKLEGSLTTEDMMKLYVRDILIVAHPSILIVAHPSIITMMLRAYCKLLFCFVQGYGKGSKEQEEDEDAGSVSSERSTFSISSEVSVNPYARYTQPLTVSIC